MNDYTHPGFSLFANSWRHRLTKRVTLSATLFSLIALTSACSMNFGFLSRDLPKMSPEQTVRDHAVRMDAALGDRSEELASLANQCSNCQKTLATFSSDARNRVESLGGMWDPWPNGVPADAQTPPPLGEAPLTPSGVVGWAAASAVRDLFASATSKDVQQDDSKVISRIAAQRLTSAVSLAKAYDINISQAASDIEALVKRGTTLLGEEEARGFGWEGMIPAAHAVSLLASAHFFTDPHNDHTHDESSDQKNIASDTTMAFNKLVTILDDPSNPNHSEHGHQKDALSDLHLKDSPHAAEAVHGWDCIVQALPKSELIDKSLISSDRKSDYLMTRVNAVLNEGAKDAREFRCILSEAQRKDIVHTLLQVDLSLMASDSRPARLLGAQSFLTDYFTWTDNLKK